MSAAKKAELKDLAEQYSRVQYSGTVHTMSGREADAASKEAARLACQIADLVIEMGLHDGGAR